MFFSDEEYIFVVISTNVVITTLNYKQRIRIIIIILPKKYTNIVFVISLLLNPLSVIKEIINPVKYMLTLQS